MMHNVATTRTAELSPISVSMDNFLRRQKGRVPSSSINNPGDASIVTAYEDS
jgi:hypothetical protein